MSDTLQQERRDDYQLQIECYVGETITVSRQVIDADGEPVDLTGKNLQFTVETKSKVNVATIENASIAVSGDGDNIFSFALPAAVTETARILECSLRDLNDGKRVWGRGQINVKYAPLAM